MSTTVNGKPRGVRCSHPLSYQGRSGCLKITQSIRYLTAATVRSPRKPLHRVSRRCFMRILARDEMHVRQWHLTVKLRGRLMSQAALRPSESHRTLPRRLQRSRGQRTRGDRWELSQSPTPRPAKAPRVLALSGHLSEPRRGAPRAEFHGPLQRWLEDATGNLCAERIAPTSSEGTRSTICSLS
jgi:hypothetical protein